jgi:hypothetical protein
VKKHALTAIPLWLCLTALAAPVALPANCPELKNSAASQALDRMTEEGDDHAASCLAGSLHSLDGGELEDALVALGRYGDSRPKELLLLTHGGILEKSSLASAVTMLPSSLSDNLQAQAAALEARRSRFRKVAHPKLLAERELVLQSLASAIIDMRAIKSDQ